MLVLGQVFIKAVEEFKYSKVYLSECCKFNKKFQEELKMHNFVLMFLYVQTDLRKL
jgi:hypothetical protein